MEEAKLICAVIVCLTEKTVNKSFFQMAYHQCDYWHLKYFESSPSVTSCLFRFLILFIRFMFTPEAGKPLNVLLVSVRQLMS